MAGPAGERIEVHGLIDLQRDLRAINRDLPKELRVVNMKAAELVADDARGRATAAGGALGKASPSIKAVAQQRSAGVRIGGSKYPFAMGGEFGSIAYKQFKPWRGSGGDAGYAVYPAKRDNTDRIVDMYGDALDELTKKAFPN